MKVLICILIVSYFSQLSSCNLIKLFDDYRHTGTSEEVDVSQCSNLVTLIDKLTSINTNGRCARFFSEKNCTGDSIEVMPNAPSHSYLGDWGFNDKTKSVGPCRDSCSPEITGKTAAVPPDVVIFNQNTYKGAHETITLDGCKLVPPGFVGNRLRSIHRNGHCVQIYKNPHCENTSIFDSIELRNNTPFHDDLSRWGFDDAKSITHCSYKCTRRSFTEKDLEGPSAGEVSLYDHTRLEGNALTIRTDHFQCVNLDHKWEGVTRSIRMGNGTKPVVLFNRRNCAGDKIIIADSSSDLGDFQDQTRSVRRFGMAGDETKSSSKNGDVQGADSTGESAEQHATYNISPAVLSTIIIVPILGVFFSVILVLVILRRCHPYKQIMDLLSEKEIQEFLNGIGMDLAKTNDDDGDYSVELVAQNKPYNDLYEIPRSDIKFDAKSPLGMGEYGIVYKGTILGRLGSDGDLTPVAIKTIKPSAGVQCLRSLLKEIKVMLHVGKHANIACLIGCCTENIRKGEVFVLMEFCAKGSLESYLHKHKSSFTNIVRKGKIDYNLSEINNTSGYKNINDFHSLNNASYGFDLFTLLKWCIEVGRGMEFLELAKVVHSDLAVRNILLSDTLEAKISDFGLSRQLYCYTQYVKKHQEPLPWRWLAPESLMNLEFSSKSDVWSFGVLCWEIFTFGDKPYPGVVFGESFISNLAEGLRLNKPKFATTECYNLMLRCWSEDQSQRPRFTELVEELEELRQNYESYFTSV